MSPAPAAISFDDVSKRYGENAAPVLDRVSLDVREREFLAVVGPSGSGKTTLLRLINRLIEPSTGLVRVNGEDVQGADAASLRRRIGYVFQGVGLFPHMTVAENIAITPRLLGSIRRLIRRSRVVLPEPDGPTTARNSRSATSSDTRSSALRPPPYDLETSWNEIAAGCRSLIMLRAGLRRATPRSRRSP